MRLAELRTYQYRNLADVQIQLPSGITILIGKNGQGKTNIVESIGLLASGKSFRTGRPNDLVSWSRSGAAVHGVVHREDGTTLELGVSIEEGSRRAYIGGHRVKTLADFLGRFVCISFSPTDLMLVRGASEERRAFIDRHLSMLEPSYVRALVTFERALRNKATLLRERSPAKMISAVNEILSGATTTITERRAAFLDELKRVARETNAELFPSGETLEIRLVSQFLRDSAPMTVTEALHVFESAMSEELRRERPAVGPHRDELAVETREQPLRTFGSQGEVRSAVIALKVAMLRIIEERIGEPAVVLLDDVDSELDAERQETLFREVLKSKRQAFITSTALPASLQRACCDELTVLSVQGGMVSGVGARAADPLPLAV